METMTEMDPCRFCGAKDPEVTGRPFINVFTGEISERIKIRCRKCGWSVEAVVKDEDRARVLWNAANRKEYLHGRKETDNGRAEEHR